MIYDKQNANRIAELHPAVAEKARQWLETLASIGVEVLITAGYRSPEEQARLYAQGRTVKGNIVTYSRPGESYHEYRLAFDFVPCGLRGDLQWQGDFDLPSRIAKKLGFEWGGDWKRPVDKPHLQYTFGLSIKDLQNGKKPPQQASFTSNWWTFDPIALLRRLARLGK